MKKLEKKKGQVDKNSEIGHHVLVSLVGHIDKDFVFDKKKKKKEKKKKDIFADSIECFFWYGSEQYLFYD